MIDPEDVFAAAGVAFDDAREDWIHYIADAFMRQFEAIRTNGADTLFGDVYDNKIQGKSGNDTLTGGRGHDALYGGEGDDMLQGASGSDALYAGAGNDTITGNDGFDFIFSGERNTQIDGGAHTDTLVYQDLNYALATLTAAEDGFAVVHGNGTDSVANVEFIQFADGSYDVAQDLFTPDPDALL